MSQRSYLIAGAGAILLAAALYVVQTMMVLEVYETASTATRAAIPLATLAAGLLPVFAETAWRSGEAIKAFVLVIPVVVLVAFILPAGIGRVTEATENRSIAAVAHNAPRKLTEDELNRTTARLEDANANLTRECRSGFGRNCEGWRRRVREIEARQAELRSSLAAMDAPKVDGVKAEAKVLGDLFEFAGWSTSLLRLQPLTLPAGMDLAIWALLWFGFSCFAVGPASHVAPAKAGPADDDGETKTRLLPAAPLHPVLQALAESRQPMSNAALARVMGVSKGEASKRRAEVAHLLREVRDPADSRRILVSLAQTLH